jgi:VIT1/CCC1 family predicted Fe2+/Mn2+ transporter
LIVGIAAALSMGASEYLSTKAEKSRKAPVRSSIYTAVTYVITVLMLIAPYLIFSNPFLCLVWTLAAAVLIIAGFNYYISVAQDVAFKRQFGEMVAVSLGVAALSFGLGHVLRLFFRVDI